MAEQYSNTLYYRDVPARLMLGGDTIARLRAVLIHNYRGRIDVNAQVSDDEAFWLAEGMDYILFWAVNDDPRSVKLEARVRLLRMDGNNLKLVGDYVGPANRHKGK